jgi:hypothetical protein
MSSNMYWEPNNKVINNLPENLTNILRKRYKNQTPICIGGFSLLYFEGLSDAGVEGADMLIMAIRKYGGITIREW